MRATKASALKKASAAAALAIVVAASGALAQVAAPDTLAQAAAVEKPASLVSRHIATVNGRAYVPLADLAKALGGKMKCTRDKARCDITTGPKGTLKFNLGALAAFVAKRGGEDVRENSKNVRQGQKAGISNIQVTIDGSDVGIQREEEEERLLLRPSPMVPVEFLGKLLGGNARYDPGTKTWRLPPGEPGCPLEYR
jgi:hypothetical protein